MGAPLSITLLCDADGREGNVLLEVYGAWTLIDAIRAYEASGWGRGNSEDENTAERLTRLAGRSKGLTFRRYKQWGMWSIRVYGLPADSRARDFSSWAEAREWVEDFQL